MIEKVLEIPILRKVETDEGIYRCEFELLR